MLPLRTPGEGFRSVLTLPKARNTQRQQQIDRIAKYSKRFASLKAHLNAPVANLSVGERRLLHVACTLISDTGIILLDEPFANLNEAAVEALQSLLRELADSGKAIVVIDHGHSARTLFDESVALTMPALY